MNKIKHFPGLHKWIPTPQRAGDYIWGHRVWVCSCGKQQYRREPVPDNPGDILDRMGEGEKRNVGGEGS